MMINSHDMVVHHKHKLQLSVLVPDNGVAYRSQRCNEAGRLICTYHPENDIWRKHCV